MSVPKDLAGIAGRLKHVTASASLALAVVVAAVSLSACSGPALQSNSADHACADKVAQAAVDASVPGLWNCLDASFQGQITQSGGQAGDHALVGQAFASSWKFLGANSKVASYELVLTPGAAQSLGFHYTALDVWLDPNGLVAGINVGSSPN